jgi:tagatose-6-phosphate ketose/aldose isomerase
MEGTMGTALTKIIDMPQDKKRERGLLYTPLEIRDQPVLWGDTVARMRNRIDEIREFLKGFMKKKRTVCILTGAGTSEFIGYCVEGLFRKHLGLPTNVISTTRIVTNPSDFFIKDCSTLLVSFARSGNSPESVGALRIADSFSGNLFRLVITCNRNGDLMSEAMKKEGSLCIDLNEKTNDNGLAMTSSFTNMVVASQALTFIHKFGEYARYAESMAKGAHRMLKDAPDIIEELCRLDFNRAVFLGSGSHYGTAVESHLKLQELTSGRVMCTYDSFPGLRHGPEAVVDRGTVVVAFLSNNPYVRRYEEDLIAELRAKKLGRAILIVCDRFDDFIRNNSDFAVQYDPEGELDLPDDVLPPIYVIAGQLLGLFKSVQLGFKPDAPSDSGIIHRVVEGVRVYDLEEFQKSGLFRTIAER